MAAVNVMCLVLQWGMFPTFEACGWTFLIGIEIYNYLYLLDRFPYQSTAGTSSVYQAHPKLAAKHELVTEGAQNNATQLIILD